MARDQLDCEVEEVALAEAGGVFGNAGQQGFARHRGMHMGRTQERNGVLGVGLPWCWPGCLPRGFDPCPMNAIDQRLEHARSLRPPAGEAKPEREPGGPFVCIGVLKEPAEGGDVNLIGCPACDGRVDVVHQPASDAAQQGVHQRFPGAEMVVNGRVGDAEISGDALDAHAFGAFVVKSPLRSFQNRQLRSLRCPTLSRGH